MKPLLLFTPLLMLLLSSCSPRVGTMITKTYPNLNPETSVVVYNYETDLPASVESLGRVTISDTGFSTNCDSITVINLIKNEARKIGGNAVCITDHIKPSFWGSSCHQMKAIVLKVNDFSTTKPLSNDTITHLGEMQQIDPRASLPKFKISANVGYGWRSAELSDNIDNGLQNHYNSLMSGMIWDVAFHYYFNHSYGVGLSYSSYYSSSSTLVQNLMTGATGTLNSNSTIVFIGPEFLMRYASNDQKWIFNLNMGLGYIGYRNKETVSHNYLKIDGSSVGTLWNISEEYKFNKNWGIGAEFSMIGGLLNEVNINTNGIKETVKLDKDNREGLGQYRLSAKICYYF